MNPALHYAEAISAGLIRIGNEEQLRKALEIHADMTQHPDDVVAEACRTIIWLSDCEERYREAFSTLLARDQLEKIP